VRFDLRIWLLPITVFLMHVAKDGEKAGWISVVIILVSAFLAPGQTPQQKFLSGQIPEAVSRLKPLGRLEGSARLRLSINLPLHDQGALTNLIEQIYDPGHPLYHHYLTPQEFDARFGPSEADYQAVIAWATRSGFTITDYHPTRMILGVSASVTDIERALRVTMRTYAHPTEHRTFFAPDTEPSIDTSLPILNIGGLDNFARPHPANLRRAPLKASGKARPLNIGSAPNGNLGGMDYRAAYAPGVSLTGTGQKVGLLEFDAYYEGDITEYESQVGVPEVPLEVLLLDGFNGEPGEADGEVALDIEMAISMAPGLSSVVLFEAGPEGVPNDVLDAMSTNMSIKQFSCSWFFGPITSGTRIKMDDYFMEFAVQGQSFFVASGDAGAATNGVAISPPGDDPYVTLVGGTVLATAGPSSAWLSETVWNAQEGPGYNESSGGESTGYGIPSWQAGVITTASNGSKTKRNCPDVAMAADNIFIVADDGQFETTGGTSCASPLWAGFAALVNQQAAALGQSGLGFLNPALYQIAANTGYTACFDDITVGNNTNTISPIHWLAVPGYDLCTGLGSPIGGSLIIALTQPDGFQITPGRGAVGNGPVGGPFTIPTQTFLLTNTGSAALNWSLGTTPAWLNVSGANGTLAAGGGGSSVVLSLNAAANVLPSGVYEADLWFTNETSGLAQLRQFTLQVGQDLVLDGGFEAGDFCYWNLAGDSSVYTNNFVDFSDDYYGAFYYAYAGTNFGALGQVSDLAYLSQSLPTQPGQLYLLSFWVENNSGDTPNQFVVQWNTDTTSTNVIYNQTDNTVPFSWKNLVFIVTAATNVTTLQFGARNDDDYFGLDNVSVLAVMPPNIQSAAAVNGTLQLAFSAVPGAEYRLQYTTNLAQGEWSDLGNIITATTNPMPDSGTIGPDPQRFYRVVLLPQ
jgi:hypothetical protein